MRFGVFYELQLPKPWDDGAEQRLIDEAVEQCVLADRLGIDHAWAVEHHFLDEYSHCSSPEVFLAAVAAKTERIRVGHGIRQVIPNYNHPARTAEGLAMLDLLSHGRVDFGIGEGATRLELGGFNIPAKKKREWALEAAREITDMMTMSPYPGFEGEAWSMPCRNVLPKPVQDPHPPLWMACTNRSTIEVAARNGVGALAFSFVDPDEARTWSKTYYDIIRSDECVPLGHSVNANIAMVSAFSLHHDRDIAVERGQDGFGFFSYTIAAMVTQDLRPAHTNHWDNYVAARDAQRAADPAGFRHAPGIGTPDEFRAHVRDFQDAGVDQIIFLQQGGKNRHDHICESLELFAGEVLDEFATSRDEREARKAEELAPHVERALARRRRRPSMAEDEIPFVRASRPAPQVNE